MPPRPLICLAVVVAAFTLLTGCNQAPVPSAAPAPVGSTRTQESTPNEDTGAGNGYTYHVRYPQLASEWSALADVLRTYAADRKKDFLDARLADETTNAPPWNLDLEFNIARRTSDFVRFPRTPSAKIVTFARMSTPASNVPFCCPCLSTPRGR